MSEQPPSSSKRWYDRDKNMSKAVQTLLTMPPEIQTIIGDGIILISDKEFDTKKMLLSLKSLGTEKVLGLYKSQNKAREYDKNPTLHKAMNHLYILPEESRSYMAVKILELSEYLYQYLKTCQEFESEPSEGEMVTVTSTYVRAGGPGAEELLTELKRIFQGRIDSQKVVSGPGKTTSDDKAADPAQKKKTDKDGKEVIREGQQGMKIRGEGPPTYKG